MMPAHYLPLHTLRTICHEIARRVHPAHIPVALSRPQAETHGVVVLLNRRAD